MNKNMYIYADKKWANDIDFLWQIRHYRNRDKWIPDNVKYFCDVSIVVALKRSSM